MGGKGETLKIDRKSIADLANDPKNARVHNEQNIKSIMVSLERFGQQKPIVVDSSNVVRAGNGTLEAARLLGWESIDCVVTDLNEQEAIAYAIADNRTAELGAWDYDILQFQMRNVVEDSESFIKGLDFDPRLFAEVLVYQPVAPQIELPPGTEPQMPVAPATDYSPSVEPKFATKEVTPESFKDNGFSEVIHEKVAKRMAMCPHCGSSFELADS